MALALTGAGAIVYTIESRLIEGRVLSAVEQEFTEFGQAIAQAPERPGLEPTGRLTESLRDYLRSNVPDDRETLIGWVEGQPELVIGGGDVERWNEQLTADPDFLDAAGRMADGGGSTTVASAEYGDLLVAAQPVREGAVEGALVVTYFLDLERAPLRETMRTYALVGLLSLVLITVLAARQSGRLLAPIRVLRETTEVISETDLAQRLPEVGNDDLTALTRTLNGMLARLEAAFADQRRFLDDAGHELKTPLTIVRGHLELLDLDDPEEVAQTRLLLLDEVDRMSRLVSDLTLLAKHDRPDFLDLGDVELEPLTQSLLAKARGLGDRDWQLDAVAGGHAHLDAHRITQAVLQLAHNAVKHTAPGEVIAVGSAVDDGWVRIWVRDVGPGVPEPERERVFERFGRARVDRDDEGFGLGLSIVRAIVTAHGGSVTLEDAEVAEDADPAGALFTLHLPQAAAWPRS